MTAIFCVNNLVLNVLQVASADDLRSIKIDRSTAFFAKERDSLQLAFGTHGPLDLGASDGKSGDVWFIGCSWILDNLQPLQAFLRFSRCHGWLIFASDIHWFFVFGWCFSMLLLDGNYVADWRDHIQRVRARSTVSCWEASHVRPTRGAFTEDAPKEHGRWLDQSLRLVLGQRTLAQDMLKKEKIILACFRNDCDKNHADLETITIWCCLDLFVFDFCTCLFEDVWKCA